MLVKTITVVLTAFLFIQLVLAEEKVLQSGPQQTVLLELFTSEGCSSCPPAEAYLNTYVKHPELWKTYFPLAFHVDYWDYIGWKDRFAQPKHGQRQQQYARWHRHSTVYTPAFFVNGEPWRSRLFNQQPAPKSKHVGILKALITNKELVAEWSPIDKAVTNKQLHVVLLGTGLTTEIEAGENEGRHAQHEFVVLGYQQVESATYQWRMLLPTNDRVQASRHALVAWVSAVDSPLPIQAVGGYLDD